MITSIILLFTYCLLVTELIELPISWLQGVHSRKGLLIVLATNMLTNPIAVFFSQLSIFLFHKQILIINLIIEIIVIAAEALVYKSFAQKDILETDFQNPVKLSIITNLLSYTIGIILGEVLKL